MERQSDFSCRDFLRFYNNQKRVAEVLELLGFENRAEFIAYLDKLLGKTTDPGGTVGGGCAETVAESCQVKELSV